MTGQLDPRAARALAVSRGLVPPDTPLPVSLPELRLLAEHLESQSRRAEIERARARRERDATLIAAERDLQAQTRDAQGPAIVGLARAWARRTGRHRGTRGRLPAPVLHAYRTHVARGLLLTDGPRWAVGERVADEREPGRAGAVVSVGADPYRGAYIYTVRYPDAPGREVPYRGGLVAARDQDQGE